MSSTGHSFLRLLGVSPVRAAGEVLRRFTLFEYGFRPFFLLAGITALLAVPLWIWIYDQGIAPLASLPPQYWHGHEMVYGFAAAAIAGFLLTAVPSWTQSRGFGGLPLVLLTVLWLAGRVTLGLSSMLPLWSVAVMELAFLPAVGVLLAPSLLRSLNRNTPMLAVIALLWAFDVAFLAALHSGSVALAQGSLRLAIDLILVLVTVIGGRIVPAFTANALRRRGQPADIVVRPWLDRCAIGMMVAIALVDAIRPYSTTSGVLAMLAAVVQGLRLFGWRGLKTSSEPIVWVLHIAYAWLPIGLMLKSISILGDAAWAAHWLHAFTMGAVGTMILAVMTRASLGHTGRPLVVHSSIAVAYLALTAGVVVRILGASTGLLDDRTAVMAAGALWTIAFLIFVIVYAPILVLPRVDGKRG